MEGRARAALFATLALALSIPPHVGRAQSAHPASLDAGALDGGLAQLWPSQRESAPDAAPEPSIEIVAQPPSAAGMERGAASPSMPEPIPLPDAIEVTVRSSSAAQRQRESAASVTVVELASAKKQAANLGEVLARVQGIHVRRAGGLGSYMRFSLNGLTDDQIRFFLDEVPLRLAGYSQSVGDVPLLFLDRVDVHRGVVPIRFGADALGGLVNLVTPQPTRGTGGDGYYQVGSFGTQRAGLSGYHVHKPTGLFTRLSIYGDYARNDYEVDVDVPDESGRPRRERLKRFHDRYRAAGGALELGVVRRRWAERLILRAFGMKLAGDVQTNQIMKAVYGDAHYSEANYGATLRYDQSFATRFRIEALTGHSFTPIEFVDQGRYAYNWRGERVRMLARPGETGNDRQHPNGYDQTIEQHASFARVLLRARLREGHRLELALTPTFTTRTGHDRVGTPYAKSALAARKDMLHLVSGIAYVVEEFDDLLENTLFAKHFLYRTSVDRAADESVSLSRFGVGDALRVRISSTLYTKLSYELTTRLPQPTEVFGNGILVAGNLELRPETSHNGNLELTLEQPTEHAGTWRATVAGFVRAVDRQIVLLPAEAQRMAYQNVYAARVLGGEGNAGWTSPGAYLTVDGNLTYLDFRNTSTRGDFAPYKGDRLPNRPYLFANAAARGQLRELLRPADELSLSYYFRYTQAFYRSWESVGASETKEQVPRQITHTLALVYSILVDKFDLSGALEVDNLSDARVFDQFGSQRPGRAYYFKLAFRR